MATAQALDQVNRETMMADKEGRNGTSAPATKGVTGLPYTHQGQSFATLDDYLAHRAYVATMDAPSLREIAPGRYVEETMGGKRKYYTRAELLRMYGFDR